ncbi:Mucolipin-2 [Phytophthora boehmeriae]|uniref:Mucolipin-2 n=1 Tax=Phytophthora boehmeriae TaxID=109152 RepID=A0A8T1X6L5_9STRA|nr:Mucolipin-2 [Phytophthora boehmeriae]
MPSDADLDAELRRGLLAADEEEEITTPLRRKSSTPMGTVERLVLSPWEKWAAHGRFPYKLMLHVALVVLTFAQMQLFDAQNAAYMRASHRNWAFFFLPEAADIGVIMAQARNLLQGHGEAKEDMQGRGVRNVDAHDNDDKVQGTKDEPFGSWTEIPFIIKLKLLNGLQLLVCVSLSLLLLSTLWSLFFLEAHMPIRFWHRLLHGTALLLLWSCFVGYLEHNRHIYSIVLTLKWGIPRVLQFLLGVSPIFCGYALFGTIYFGNKIEEFGTMSASMVTLFSLMNGDIIMDTFDAMELHHFAVSGKVYLYTFISLFMYVVLNIFIAIVEEAFFATQSTRRRLRDFLTDPRVSRANTTKEADISAEMMRALLQRMDSD